MENNESFDSAAGTMKDMENFSVNNVTIKNNTASYGIGGISLLEIVNGTLKDLNVQDNKAESANSGAFNIYQAENILF